MCLIVVIFVGRDDTLITEISNTLPCNKPVKYDFCIAVNDVGNIKYLENCFIVFSKSYVLAYIDLELTNLNLKFIKLTEKNTFYYL